MSNRILAAVAARPLRSLALAALAALPFAAAIEAAPAVSTVAAFNGSVPASNLLIGTDGAIYGASAPSTSVTGGLIFRAATDGSSITTIYQLSRETDGQAPQAGLLLASDGKFYGTTKFGKSGTLDTTGTIFRLSQAGSGFEVLHRFAPFTAANVVSSPINTDGAYPSGELIEGTDGFLYGVTSAGGTNGTGVVFRIARDGSGFQVLHQFAALTTTATDTLAKNADGIGPSGVLVQAADGMLYGTASAGGVNGRGTIYRVGVDGTGFQVIRTFPSTTTETGSTLAKNADGAVPLAGLLDGQDGFLYGVASLAGTKGYGTVFAISHDGAVFGNLHDFDNLEGSRPVAELAAFSDGKLYGTTASGGKDTAGNATSFGTLFSIARDGTGFTVLHNLDGKSGASPSSQLIQLSPTLIIGAASAGSSCGAGGIFRYDATGGTITGDTKCGRKKGNAYGGGGATGPAVLLLLGGLALARRRRR